MRALLCRHILAVILGGSRAQIVHAGVTSAALYAGFRILCHTENMRLSSLRNDPNALQFPNYIFYLGERGPETAVLSRCRKKMLELVESHVRCDFGLLRVLLVFWMLVSFAQDILYDGTCVFQCQNHDIVVPSLCKSY